MSSALNGSLALQLFECGNMVKICNGIMFDFYPGLPQMYVPELMRDTYSSTETVTVWTIES